MGRGGIDSMRNTEVEILFSEHPDYANENREAYVQEMLDTGFTIVYPKANELQIDIDTEEAFAEFKHRVKSLVKEYKVKIKINPSRHGLPGRHATITLPFDVTEVERIAWQSVLGSDPVRELLSMLRLQRGDSVPTLFVERKED
jgi:hypothetical protein